MVPLAQVRRLGPPHLQLWAALRVPLNGTPQPPMGPVLCSKEIHDL